jgi:ribosomal protein S17
MKQDEIILKVSEAFQQDVGYGRARIDHQTRIDLDLSIGDVIEIAQCRPHSKTKNWRLVRVVTKASQA